MFAQLRDEVAWSGLMASRETASMGVPYNYGGGSYPVAPWHPRVARVAALVEEALGFAPTNCLLNYYPTGRSSMGWHADDVDILEPGTAIAIVSVGASRVLKMRTGGPGAFVYVDQILDSGSLLVMSAAMQADWKHSMRRTARAEGRISMSFRRIVRWEASPELAPRWGT